MAPLSTQACKAPTEGSLLTFLPCLSAPCILSARASLLQFFSLNHLPQSGSAHTSPFPQSLKYPSPASHHPVNPSRLFGRALKVLHDPPSSCHSDSDLTAGIKPSAFRFLLVLTPLPRVPSLPLHLPLCISVSISVSQRTALSLLLICHILLPIPTLLVLVTHLTVLSVCLSG